jgi:hypothetical protein
VGRPNAAHGLFFEPWDFLSRLFYFKGFTAENAEIAEMELEIIQNPRIK